MMLCPFCLSDVVFQKQIVGQCPVYRCPNDGEPIPSLYVAGYSTYLPVAVNAVALPGNGRTTYFASLFYSLRRPKLASSWGGFSMIAVDDCYLRIVNQNVDALSEGRVPDRALHSFPVPAPVRVSGVPACRDCTLVFYDTDGEALGKPTQPIPYGSFVKRAQAVMLLIGVSRLSTPGVQMHDLLTTYIVEVGKAGARTQGQHLIVVYTFADELRPQFQGEWDCIDSYLLNETHAQLASGRHYAEQLEQVSGWLAAFARRPLQADDFVNTARRNFKSVAFSVVSSLGARPEGGELGVGVTPRRVLDPLLWVLRSCPVAPRPTGAATLLR